MKIKYWQLQFIKENLLILTLALYPWPSISWNRSIQEQLMMSSNASGGKVFLLLVPNSMCDWCISIAMHREITRSLPARLIEITQFRRLLQQSVSLNELTQTIIKSYFLAHQRPSKWFANIRTLIAGNLLSRSSYGHSTIIKFNKS